MTQKWVILPMLYSGFILPLYSFSYLILNSSHSTKSSFQFPFMMQFLYLTYLGSCHWDFSTWLPLTILCGSMTVVVNLPRFCWHVTQTHTWTTEASLNPPLLFCPPDVRVVCSRRDSGTSENHERIIFGGLRGCTRARSCHATSRVHRFGMSHMS